MKLSICWDRAWTGQKSTVKISGRRVMYFIFWKHFTDYARFEYLITHRRTIAERGGCFQRHLFVSLFVCLFVNTITSERLNVGWWKLAVRCFVQNSRPSSNAKVKGQRSRSLGQKRKSATFCSGVVLWGAVLVRHIFRERSSGARSTGALRTCQFYAGGKISACCQVLLRSHLNWQHNRPEISELYSAIGLPSWCQTGSFRYGSNTYCYWYLKQRIRYNLISTKFDITINQFIWPKRSQCCAICAICRFAYVPDKNEFHIVLRDILGYRHWRIKNFLRGGLCGLGAMSPVSSQWWLMVGKIPANRVWGGTQKLKRFAHLIANTPSNFAVIFLFHRFCEFPRSLLYHITQNVWLVLYW